MKRRLIRIVIAALVSLAAVSALAQMGGGYDLSWNTFDGGGASNVTSGGSYVLSGSIGQPDANAGHTGGSYTLQGGFWYFVAQQNEPTPTATATSTSTATNTPTDTSTATATATDTSTATPSPTNTPTDTSTATPSPTNTPSVTSTATNTPSVTSTATNTPTGTSTTTATRTPTRTPTFTATIPVHICVLVSRTLIQLNEATPGFTVIYNVRLSAAPAIGEQVTITPITYNGAQITLSPLSRILNNSNYAVGKNFTVAVINDVIVEANIHTTVIEHSTTSNTGGSVWNGARECADINVEITDNDGLAATATATRTATRTSTPTVTTTATPSPTNTASPVATDTPTQTATATETPTATASSTSTPTSTPTATDTPTATASSTLTPTATVTSTPTATPSPTRTNTRTPTPGTIAIHVPSFPRTVIEGGTFDWVVRLASQPPVGETITVQAMVVDGQTTLLTGMRQFNSVNWNTGKTFSAQAVDDTLDEANVHQGLVMFSVTSSNPASAWNFVAPNFITANITDND